MKTAKPLTRKKKRIIVFLVLTSLCLVYLLYAVAIPRSELAVNTVVHESFSGISVGMTIKNSGNLEIEDLVLNITVTDKDDEEVYSSDVEIGNLGTGEKAKHSFTFSEPKAESYNITIKLSYVCDGQNYDETIEHEIKDYMNFTWKDTFRDWRL